MELLSIHVFVKPNAKKTAYLTTVNGVMHIALKARPEEDEANLELCRFLAEIFEIPKSLVQIYRGKKSRNKIIRLPKDKIKLETLSQFQIL